MRKFSQILLHKASLNKYESTEMHSVIKPETITTEKPNYNLKILLYFEIK